MRFRFAAQDFFGARIWVSPDYRGQGIAPKVIRYARAYFLNTDRWRSLGIINGLNKSSRRACAKTGIAETGRILYLRLLGITYLHYGRINRIGFWNAGNRLEIPFPPIGCYRTGPLPQTFANRVHLYYTCSLFLFLHISGLELFLAGREA